MPNQSSSYFGDTSPLILAHRGFASGDVQENTLAAFQAALDAGATHLESDVQATADGVAVLFHDETLQRVFGRREKISELTLAQLTALAPEQNRVPTLAQAIGMFPKARFNLDIKTSDAVLPAVQALAEDPAPWRFLVSSFSRGRRLRALKELSARGIRVVTSADALTLLLLILLFRLRLRSAFFWIAGTVDALQIPVRSGVLKLDEPVWVRWVLDAKLQLHYWTINEPSEALRLLGLGATGIVTDRTDLMADLGNKKS